METIGEKEVVAAIEAGAADVAAKGIFVESLQRNNTKIKHDRAEAISEDTEMIYRRAIENIDLDIRKLKRKRVGMLDLSPNNALNLKSAEDHDPEEWVEKDTALGLAIREEEIKRELAGKRYTELFGGSI